MKWVSQEGRPVCQLAALAMVADKTLEEVERIALSFPRYRHRSWEGVLRHKDTSRFWSYVRWTVKALGLPEHIIPSAEGSIYGGIWQHEHRYAGSRGMYQPVLMDRGLLSFRSTATRRGHVVAFENGWLYDPNYEKPYQYVDLHEYYPWAERFVVTRVDGAPVRWKVLSWETVTQYRKRKNERKLAHLKRQREKYAKKARAM